MSLKYGMAALNLEMTDRVPRTEYGAEYLHWELVNHVTGIDAMYDKSKRSMATSAFMKAWDYDFAWASLIHAQEFNGIRNTMGVGGYAVNNEDHKEKNAQYFADEEAALNFDPTEAFGVKSEAEMIKMFNDHYKMRCDLCPDTVNMTGTYVTLVSGMIALLGWDLLLASAGYDLDEFGELVRRYAKWMMNYMKALAKSDTPVVMVHDDIVWGNGPFINPEWYRKYVFPEFKKFFDVLKDGGKKIVYTADGDYTMFLDDIVNAGAESFVFEPTTDMEYFAKKYGKTHSFIGNADTRILLSGTNQDIENEVKRCMDIGKNCPGFIMAVGNQIPPNTPIEKALYYNEMYKKHCHR